MHLFVAYAKKQVFSSRLDAGHMIKDVSKLYRYRKLPILTHFDYDLKESVHKKENTIFEPRHEKTNILVSDRI